MKNKGFKAIMAIVGGLLAAVLLTVQVSAMTPTLSLVNNGYGSLQVTVYGDANASVILDYYYNGQLMGAGVIGYTNYSGSLSTTLNPNNYNIPNGAQVYVMVDGQQSPTTIWSGNNGGYNNGNNSTLSLSQSSVTLTTGQTTTITSYNNSGSLYISTNSNSSVATATIYNNQLSITGQSYGSTTINICSNYNRCASVYVNVSYSSNQNNTPVTLSQTNANITIGQSQTISINNNYNTGYNNNQYYLSNLSNGIVSATLNGNTLTLYGQSAGTTSISVCSSSNTYNVSYGNTCASVYVTVTGNYYNPNPVYPVYPTYPTYPTIPVYNTPISVSNSNVQVTVGNSGVVTLYGGSNSGYYGNTGYSTNSFYVSNNNSSIATANIYGNTLTVYGTQPGNTNITVCSSNSSGCATVNVIVIAPVSNYYNSYSYNGGYNNYNYSNNGMYWNNQLNCWMRN